MWQPIETAPRDRDILLYWPAYAYNYGEESYPLTAIGFWKRNRRLESYTDDAQQFRCANADEIEAELTAKGMVSAYFSNNGEQDDYGLAQLCHSPSHWMPLPEPPHKSA